MTVNPIKRAALTALILFAGCASLESKPADGIEAAKHVNILITEASRDSFMEAIVIWLTKQKITTSVVDSAQAEGWYLDCTASWSWDLAFYLNDARVTAFENGVEKGSAHYHLTGGMWSLDPDKWHTDATTVDRMLKALFGMPKSPKRVEE